MAPLIFLALTSLLLLLSPSSALCVPKNSSHSHHHHHHHHHHHYHHHHHHHHHPQCPSPPTTQNTTLNVICSHTENRALCKTILAPFLSKGVAVTPRFALDAHMKACAEHTNAAAAVVGKLLSNPLTPSMITANLRVCQDNYSDSLDNIDQAKTALTAGDKATVNIMISAALSDYDTCEDGFSELPGTASPLASYNLMLSKIASNCLAIAELA